MNSGEDQSGNGREDFVHIFPGSAVSCFERRIFIDFVTSESGTALIWLVHFQYSKLIAKSHGSSRNAAGTRAG